MIQKLYILTSTSHIIVTCIQHFKVDIQNEIFLKKKGEKKQGSRGQGYSNSRIGCQKQDVAILSRFCLPCPSRKHVQINKYIT
jgi:hypothetical protein